MRQAVRNAFRFFGYNLTRWDRFPFMPHVRSLGIDVVLDVGANTGQYARLLRASGYDGKIVSFEPVQAAFLELKQSAASDPLWTCFNLALGSEKGEAPINIGHGSNMSSFRRINADHAERHYFARTVGIQSVQISTIDNIFDDCAQMAQRVLLKMDVQGYEDEVLKGATNSLNKIAAIQTEMSIVPTYSDQKDICATIADLKQVGFDLVDLLNGFRESDYRLLEVDGFFVRRRN